MAATYIITLVHGTWARRAEWCQPGSSFCSAVQQVLGQDVEFHAFQWSGRNSIRARSQASTQLRQELLARISLSPNAKHFVVAHSHGGNVALAALNEVDVRDHIAGLVCLSTPFFAARGRNWGISAPFLVGLLAFSLAAAAVSVVFPPAMLWTAGLAMQIVAGGLVVAAFLLLICLGAFLKVKATRILDSLTFPPIDHRRVMIIRSPADEASGALIAAQFASWVLERLWSVASTPANFILSLELLAERVPVVRGARYAARMVVMLIAVVTGIALGWPVYDELVLGEPSADIEFWRLLTPLVILSFVMSPDKALELLGWAISYVTLLVLVPVGIAVSVLSIGCGIDALMMAGFFELTIEVTPPGGWHVHLLTPDHSPIWQHSASYHDAEALALIGGWIQSAVLIDAT